MNNANKPKTLFFDIAPWYTVNVYPDGSVKIYSSHIQSKGKELSQWFTAGKDSYLRTKLFGESRTIHSIVAECAHGLRPKGLCINHKDGNKLNNHPDNLEYCTRADNTKHSFRTGLHIACDPTKMPTYIDGRASKHRLNDYKLEWYHVNKARLKRECKGPYAYLRGK